MPIKKPKVAICFFGHLRTFEKCLPNIYKHLISMYDCDIFMHTWDVYNHNTKTWHTNFKNSNKKVNQDKIIKVFGITPEQIQIEHQEIYSTGKFISRGREWALQSPMSMYHSIKNVNELREKYQRKHHIKYDIIVFIRPDILLFKDLNLDKYINDELNTNEKNVYFSGHGVDRDMYGMNYIETADLLFFGKPKTMSAFCSDIKVPVKDGDVIDYYPDGFLIDNILHAKLKPVFIGSYQYGKALKIKRYPQIKLNRSNIFSFHIRKHGVYLYLLRVLPPVININTNLFGWFDVVISVGKTD